MNYNNEIDNLNKFGGLSLPDFATLLFGILLALSGAFLLWQSSETSQEYINLKPIATIKGITEKPKRKLTGSLSWTGVKRSDQLYKGDEILTDDSSKAVVEFNDKTRLSIPSNSLVRIDTLDDAFNINIIKGVVDLDVKKGTKKIILKTRNKEYILRPDKSSKISVKSTGTDLDISSSAGKLNVVKKTLSKANDKKISNIKTVTLKPAKLRIIRPSYNQSYSPLKDNNIQIELSSLKEFSTVNGTITGDNYEDTFTFLTSVKNAKLPTPGKYTLKINAKDKNNKTVQKSVEFNVEGYKAPSFANTLPKFFLINKGESISINWSGRKDLGYIISLTNDRTQKESTLKSGTNSLTLKPQTPGNFTLKVKIDEQGSRWSESTSIEIKFKSAYAYQNIENPELIDLHKTNGLVTLKVKKNENPKEQYFFRVFAKDNIDKPIYMRKISTETISWRPKVYGDFLWDIKESSQRNVDASTDANKLRLRNEIVKIRPSQRSYIKISKTKPTINFEWIENYPKNKYFFEIYSKNSKKKLATKEVNYQSARITFPSPGQYLWKITPQNESEFLFPTPMQELTLAMIELETPKVPAKQIIRYKNLKSKESYKVQFPPVENASRYFIEIYSDEKLEEKIVTARSRRNYFYWVTRREGKYYFRVSYLDKWGRKSSLSNVGQIVFPISPLLK